MIFALQPGQDGRANWRNVNDAATTAAAAAAALNSHRGDSSRGRLRNPDYAPPYHPFQLYTLPPLWRATPNPAADWLKYRVRSGALLVDKADGSVTATGTDGFANPYDVLPCADTAANEVTLATGVTTYFWLEINGAAGSLTATVKHGTNPVAVNWDGWPTVDSNHLIIGSVDTTDPTGTRTATVRQYLREDVFWLPGQPVYACYQGQNRQVYIMAPAVAAA